MTSLSRFAVLTLAITVTIAAEGSVCGQVRKPVKVIYPNKELNKKLDEDSKKSPTDHWIAQHRKWLDSKNPDERHGAIDGMLQGIYLPAKIGVPLCLDLLEHPAVRSDRQQYPHVMHALIRYGAEAKGAVPKLLAICKTDTADQGVKAQQALFALLQITPGDPALLPLLVKNIDSAYGAVTESMLVLDAIGGYGVAARKALPDIERYLTHRDEGVAFHAFKAAGRLRDRSPPSLAELVKWEKFQPEGDDKGYAVLAAVQRDGKKLGSLVPKLVQALNHDYPVYYRMMLLETLGKVGPGNAEAVQALLEKIALEKDPIRVVVSAALNEQVRPEYPAVVPVLAKALRHPDAAVRWSGITGLKKFGRRAASAADALADAIGNADENTQTELFIEYLSVVRELGTEGAPVAEALVAQLPGRSKLYKGRREYMVPHLQLYILLTLADVGVPKTALPFILDILNNNGLWLPQSYAAAAHAAAVLGKDAKEAVPGLLRALAPDVRDIPMSLRAFIEASAWYGPPPHANTSLRIEAIRALAQIGPDARAALPALKRLASQPLPPGSRSVASDKEAVKAIRAIEGK